MRSAAVELPDANSESATGRPQVVRTGVEIPIGLLGVSDGSLDVPTVVRDEIELRTDPFQGPREALDRKPSPPPAEHRRAAIGPETDEGAGEARCELRRVRRSADLRDTADERRFDGGVGGPGGRDQRAGRDADREDDPEPPHRNGRRPYFLSRISRSSSSLPGWRIASTWSPAWSSVEPTAIS